MSLSRLRSVFTPARGLKLSAAMAPRPFGRAMSSVATPGSKGKGYDVVAYIANLGQPGEDFEAAKKKALSIGASSVHIEDLRKPFVEDYIFPSLQANGIYENLYLMGTSLARPCIAKRAVEIAHQENCRFLAHGATGKGNDQVRFELTFAALDPTLQSVVPWRDPAFFNRFRGRNDLIDFAASKGLPVTQTKAKPYSMDENLLHISYEAGILEDPSKAAPEDMFRMTVDPAKAPDTPALLKITFEKGLPVRIENKADGTDITDSLEGFLYLNKIGGEHGVGRVDVVESRFVGLKSRGVYETPGGEVLRQAHIGIEGLTLDREVFRLRDMMSAKFAELAYNGFWYSPEMDFILHAVKKSQERVTGSVEVKLFKGKASVVSRSSPLYTLYNQNLASMDEGGGWDPTNSTGFIKINSVRLKSHYLREKTLKDAGKA